MAVPQVSPSRWSLPTAGTVLDGTFLIHRQLGSGTMGAVYLAEDLTLGRRVALKLLRPELGQRADAILRFRREAQAIARLRCPYAVRLLGFGQLEDRICYLVMEFVEGCTLRELIRQQAPMTPRRTVAILTKIAEVLHDAHRAGVVHRDLKPDNILVTERGGEQDFVKVLDFGLARLRDEPESADSTEIGTILGTPAYMAPEQALGKPAEPRSDLYALGLIGYELLTGQRPFRIQQPLALLVAQATQIPARPSESHPALAIPLPLEALIMAMLHKAADDRPSDAGRVLTELDNLLSELSMAERPTSRQVRLIHEGPQHPDAEDEGGVRTIVDAVELMGDLVGRAAEQAQLQALLVRLVRERRGGVALLLGEPGTGKTALVEWLQQTAAAFSEARFAVGHYREGSALPCEGLSQVLAGLYGPAADDPPPVETEDPPSHVRDPGWPLLQRLIEPARALDDVRLAAQPLKEHGTLPAIMTRFLLKASWRQPLLMVLEDLHWADGLTMELLAQLSERLRHEDAPLLLVLTARSGGRQRLPAALTKDTADPESLVRLELQPLALHETCALIRRGLQASDGLCATLQRLSDGNPHLIGHLLQYLVSADLLCKGEHGWQLMAGVQEGDVLPQDLRQLEQELVDRLLLTAKHPAFARLLVEIATFIGLRFPAALLERVLVRLGQPFSTAQWAQALTDLIGCGLFVSLPGAVLAFRTERVREVLAGLLAGKPQAGALHAAVADAKEHYFGAQRPDLAAELAHHYQGAGMWQRAFEAYGRAADLCRCQKNLRGALEHEQARAQLLDEHPESFCRHQAFALHLSRGRLHLALSALEQTAQCLEQAEQACDEPLSPAEQADLALERAALLEAHSAYAEALQQCHIAEAAAAFDPLRLVAARNRAGQVLVALGQLDTAEQVLSAALAQAPAQASSARAEALLHLGIGRIRQGRAADAETALHACLEAHATLEEPRSRARCLNSLGVVAYLRGDMAQATAQYHAARALSEQVGDQQTLARTLMNLATIHHREGRLAQAIESYERSVRQAMAIDSRAVATDALINLALAQLDVAEFAEATENLDRAHRLLATTGYRPALVLAYTMQAVAERRMGHLDAALHTGQKACGLAQELGARALWAQGLVSMAEVELARGHLPLARCHLEQALDLARQSGDEGSVALAQGTLGACYGDSDEERRAGRERFEQAYRWQAAHADRRQLVRVSVRLGALLLAQGEHDLADERLRQAIEIAEQSGYLDDLVIRGFDRLADLARLRQDSVLAERFTRRRKAARQRYEQGGGSWSPNPSGIPWG